ncbi:hypothetical protein SOVF_070590 [Spinacia oleracea]|nr:hypothetical protein SOVF_070590 [Spinacia oleracea]
MKDNPKLFPSLPPNYVSIVDLQKRWQQQQLQQQQQQQQQKKEESNEKVISKDGGTEYVKRSWKLQEFNRSKFVGNPNFATRRPVGGNFYGERELKVFREVVKVSDSRTKASKINDAKVDEKTTPLIKSEKDESNRNNLSNGEDVKRGSQCRKSDGNPNLEIGRPFHQKFYGKKRSEEFLAVEKMSSPMPEVSENNGGVKVVEIDCGDKEMGDRKLEDKKEVKKERKKWKKMKNKKGKGEKQNSARKGEWEERQKQGEGGKVKYKQGKGGIEEKEKHWKEGIAADDDAVEEKEKHWNREIGASNESIDKEMGASDEAAKRKGKQGKGEMGMGMGDEVTEVKDNQEDRQDDEIEEIKAKLKEIYVKKREWKNGRSTVVKEGLRRAHWGYSRVERCEFGKMKWEAKRICGGDQ